MQNPTNKPTNINLHIYQTPVITFSRKFTRNKPQDHCSRYNKTHRAPPATSAAAAAAGRM